MDDENYKLSAAAGAQAAGPLLATPGAAQALARSLELGPVRLVDTGAQLLAEAVRGEAAAAVVAEALPDMSGLELCRALRAARLGSGLPLILLTDRYSDQREEAALAAGADEYVDQAQVGPRLLRRLRSRLQRAAERAEQSPLTGLPGRGRLERELAARLPRRGELATVALDVRRFKAFNDRYGYRRGDRLLRLVRDVALEALQAEGQPSDLLIHLGGDDFFLLAPPQRAARLVERMQADFARRVVELYDPADRQAGGLRGGGRTGETPTPQAAALVAVGVSNADCPVREVAPLARLLAELKEHARRTEKETLWWQLPAGSPPGTSAQPAEGEI